MKKRATVCILLLLLLVSAGIFSACNSKVVTSTAVVSCGDVLTLSYGGSKTVEIYLKDSSDLSYSTSELVIKNYDSTYISCGAPTGGWTKYYLSVVAQKVSGSTKVEFEFVFNKEKKNSFKISGSFDVTVMNSPTIINAVNLSGVGIGEKLMLGQSYEALVSSKPDGATEGLEISSSDEKILQKIGDHTFRAVGVGYATVSASSLTVEDKAMARYQVQFGDSALESYIKELYSDDADNLNSDVLSQITSLSLTSSVNAANLNAVNAFVNLESLTLRGMRITALNLSGTTNLTQLTITACDLLEEICISNVQSDLTVNLSCSGLKKLSVDNSTRVALSLSSTINTPLKNLSVTDVGAFDCSDDSGVKMLKNLEVFSCDGLSDISPSTLVFDYVKSVSMTNFPSGIVLDLPTRDGAAYSLELSSSAQTVVRFAERAESERFALFGCTSCIIENCTFDSDGTVNVINRCMANAKTMSLTNVALNVSTNTVLSPYPETSSLTDLTLDTVPGVTEVSGSFSYLEKLSINDLSSLKTVNIEGKKYNSYSQDSKIFVGYSVTACSELATLKLRKAPDVTFSDLPILRWLQIEMSFVRELDLSEYANLNAVIADSNPSLAKLSCKNIGELYYLSAAACGILASLDITGSYNLREVYAPGCLLSSLTLVGAPTNTNEIYACEKVQLNDNYFTNINFIEYMPRIKVLDMANNRLVDLTALEGEFTHKNLVELYLNGNQFFANNSPDGVSNVNAISTVASKLLRFSCGVNSGVTLTSSVKSALQSAFKKMTSLQWLQAYRIGFTTEQFTSEASLGGICNNGASRLKYLDVRFNSSINKTTILNKFQNDASDLKLTVADTDDIATSGHGSDIVCDGAVLKYKVDKVKFEVTVG